MSQPPGLKADGASRRAALTTSGVHTAWIVVALLGAVAVLPMFVIDFQRLFLPTAIDAAAVEQDYWAFYAGARAAWTGLEGNLHDPAVMAEYLGAPTTLLWLYPPTILPILAPFGPLPYALVKVLWVVLALGSSTALVKLVTGSYRAAALVVLSPLGWASLYVGQVGAVFGLWLVAGLTQANRRPHLAGACIALLTVKPQYGLLVIPFLVVTRAWRALGTAAVLGVGLHLGTWLLFGSRAWDWFLTSVGEGSNASFALTRGHNGRITALDAGGAVGVTLQGQWLVWGAVLAAALAGLVILRRRASPELLLAYVLAATVCVAPYFWLYDYFVLYAALLVVVVRAPHPTPLQIGVISAAWFAPAVPFFSESTMVPAFLWPLNLLAAVLIFRMGMARSQVAAPMPPAMAPGGSPA